MAINNIPISQLPLMGESVITDDTIFVAVEGDLDYSIKYSTIKDKIIAAYYLEKPLGEISLTTGVDPVQSIDTAVFTKVTVFDKIDHNTGIDVSLTNSEITVTEAGNYRISPTVNVELAVNAELEVALLLNSAASDAIGFVTGKGSGKPIFMGTYDIDYLNIGDKISLGIREAAGGSLDVTFKKVRILLERA